MTAATLTLTDFLLARIAEDEAPARRSISERYGDSDAPHLQGCDLNTYDVGPCGCDYPQRVLAECEAKRRIVELARYVEDAEGGGASIALLDGYRAVPPGFAGAVGVLPALAAVYADHPDYRDEWRT